MILTAPAILTALAIGAPAQGTAALDTPFPPSTALAEGVSPEALAALSELVQGFVDEGEIVGGELLVIKNGRSILHEAYGWRDQEAEVPMETGSVFCVRSMTKPVVGAAIRMLVEDRLLELDDPVAEYLPSFDVEGSRDITVEHLLTHTSGLPMSLIMARDPRTLESIRTVADLGGGHALDFEPGSAFQYSDQGTDTLTALIEVVTGAPAADFVRARVLEPLGMRDSACVMTEESPLRARACCAYAGSTGAWTRFWGPDEPALFPIFLGSQGLYSTVEDYARFLDLWMKKGRASEGRLLRMRSVRETLTPGMHAARVGASGFPELRADYGSLMQLWTRSDPGGEGAEAEEGGAEDGEREVVVFGHTGSDGTHAWAFPEEKALVLYFTQSRGTLTGLRVEERLGELLLGVPFDPTQAAPPLEQYLGYYWEGEGDLYRAIVRDGDDLALEILGKAVVPLTYVGEDRWKLRPQPGTVIAFDRAETGEVTGYHIGDHQEFRFEPSADLPGADEIAARVAATHRIDLLESLGPVRMKSRMDIEKLGITGQTTFWLGWPNRWRLDDVAGEEVGRVSYDGELVRQASGAKPVATLEGTRAEETRLESPLVRFGDWRRFYPNLRVIQRLEGDGDEALLVRVGDTSAPAPTMYVDARTGRVRRVDSVTFMEGLGRIGRRLTFDDFRDVTGMLLPYRTRIQLANPLIGEIVTTVEAIELGVELPDGLFELRDD